MWLWALKMYLVWIEMCWIGNKHTEFQSQKSELFINNFYHDYMLKLKYSELK